jgi:predicted choloylglycine hydrolase
MALTPVTLRFVDEPEPGATWAALFEERWPAYRTWFLQDGEEARATYGASIRLLADHLPEIVPLYERLVELAGGGDLAARLLSMVQPPSYLAACSQAAFTAGRPVLVRNYDYLADRFDGIVMRTAWTGRRVIGTIDCLWGLLDGVNDAGLAVSLTFGGRRVIGHGFGIPLIVRYLLETCTSVDEAIAVLRRVPFHLAHNLTLLDATGSYVTAYLAPDREPVFAPVPWATNHQDVVDWPEYAAATRSHEREALVRKALAEAGASAEHVLAAFLHPPLRDSAGADHFGTLYTAAFHPLDGLAEYRWPDASIVQSFSTFSEISHTAWTLGDRRATARPHDGGLSTVD